MPRSCESLVSEQSSVCIQLYDISVFFEMFCCLCIDILLRALIIIRMQKFQRWLQPYVVQGHAISLASICLSKL